MKNIVTSIILALFLVMSASYATVFIVEDSVFFDGSGDGLFSQNKQELPDEGIITIQNDFLTSVTVLLVDTELILDSSNQLNITTAQPIIIPANSSVQVVLDVDSINDIEAGEYFGTLRLIDQISSLEYDTLQTQVLVPALEVTDVDVNDNRLEKGQKFTVTVDYENLADIADLEDVEITVGIYRGDENDLDDLLEDADGDDLEDSEDVGDLRDGRSGTVTFEFEFPFDVDDEEEFTILAEIEGKSEEVTSARFYAMDTQSIEASVPDSRVEINKLTAFPTTLQCGFDTVRFNVELRNIGDSREDIQLFIRSPSSSFEHMFENGEEIELDDDFSDEDEYTEKIEEYITLTNLRDGQNIFRIIAYYDDNDKTVTQDISITSESCNVVEDVVVDDPIVIVVPTTTPIQPIIVPTTTPQVTLKDVSGYSVNTGWVVPTIVGVAGAAIGLVIALLFIRK